MKLTLERFGFGLDSTLGVLSVDGKPSCFTVEDERRQVKVPGETCIPTGTYGLKLRADGGLHKKYAKRFPAFHMGMLWLQDVPGFEWIYLHCGNTDDDTEGCPLVVTTPIVDPMGEFRGAGSVPAYERLYMQVVMGLGEGPVTLTVREREAA